MRTFKLAAAFAYAVVYANYAQVAALRWLLPAKRKDTGT